MPIPLYRYDGALIDWISPTRAERLFDAGRAKLVRHKKGAINRVILCSDGVANVGQTEADSILEEIRAHVQEGMLMTTIGFGMDNYNDTLMEQLANDGNGFYAYVDDMPEAKRLFIDNLTSTLQTIARTRPTRSPSQPKKIVAGMANTWKASERIRTSCMPRPNIVLRNMAVK